MRRIRKLSAVFLLAVLFWLIAPFLDANAHNMSNQKYSQWTVFSIFEQKRTGEERKQTEEPATVRTVDIWKPDTTPKPSGTPQPTQIPSAKGVTTKKIYRLAQLMYAENGSAEDDDCVLLTGIVVVKRMKSKKYPNTLEGVISQEGQYSTYQTGKIECEPDERCLEIAEEILRFDLQKYYPDNLVFQAEFPQGSKTYEQFGHEYFCLD